ncbi:hypothetical protein CAEBREN_10515 [Caenorhabditis brenneri]|uniref:BTB domain-containing protein n=1 Tax=Caenorhabditis brenneri TaxID=135651 RepID=G0MCN9_CAEBE|nr:hypothetical protein CAEBREN_10515 [Caenorhabditis brenneri]
MDPTTPFILSNTGVMHFETNDFRSISEPLCHSSSAIIGNNEWCWHVHQTVDSSGNKEKLGICLGCNKNVKYSRLWSCDATYRFVICNLYEEEKDIVIERRQIFDRNNTDAFLNEDILIEDLRHQIIKDNKFKMRVEITVHESSGFRMPVFGTFDRPIEHLTDVILLVEDKKVYIGKQALATHSGFFRDMFFGSFAEQSKEEVELKDVKHSEFVDLLNMIFPSHLRFNEDNIAHILKLANRFEVHKVMDKAEQFLLHSEHIPAELKSELLGSYRFPRVENYADDQPGLYDAILVTGNKEIPIGKQTMAMHSEYFRRKFFEDKDPIDRVVFDEVGSSYIEDFLKFVFKPQQNFTGELSVCLSVNRSIFQPTTLNPIYTWLIVSKCGKFSKKESNFCSKTEELVQFLNWNSLKNITSHCFKMSPFAIGVLPMKV